MTRALCESCGKPQPADWRPGDLCVHCGLAVREQLRCYWCAHWIPAGNFCRNCGAEAIASEQYGPARVLKFYGADVFSIPQKLHDMDPARVDTFRSIYGKHLGVAMRHVEGLRELETELFHKHWSGELEETLIPQLPWPEDKLEQYSGPDRTGQNSPFSIISTLALIVAIRKGDFDLIPRHGSGLVCSSIPELRLEAALQLANWRVSGNTYLESLRYAVMDVLRPIPQKTVLIRLSQAYLGERDVNAPEESVTSDDPEIAFFGALMLKNEPIIIRGLSSANPLQRMVAAEKLISLNRADAIVDLYRRWADPDQQQRLLQRMQLVKHPVPTLHEALFETIARHPKTKLARTAASAICQGCSHAEAMRLAELFDPDILHSLSLAKAVEPETLRGIGELLVKENRIDNRSFGWMCMAKPGRMPFDFVERVWNWAAKPETQIELLQFAEKQLDELPERPSGTSMERVMIHAAFGDYAPGVIGAAWVGLHRINYHRSYGSITPFPYSVENIEQFWPIAEFEQRLARLQANEAALNQTWVSDELRRFLTSGDRN